MLVAYAHLYLDIDIYIIHRYTKVLVCVLESYVELRELASPSWVECLPNKHWGLGPCTIIGIISNRCLQLGILVASLRKIKVFFNICDPL